MNWKYHEYNKIRYRYEALLLMNRSFWIEDCIKSGSEWLRLDTDCLVEVNPNERYRLPLRSEYLARCAAQRYDLLAILENEG